MINMIKYECIKWIRNWFDKNGKDCNAVIGISGGKDSSICAALCVEALGKERVIGVLMPNDIQEDIAFAIKLVDHLGIKYTEVNIEKAYTGIIDNIIDYYEPANDGYYPISITEQTEINLAPRLRMTALYAVSQSMNGRVCNTCNLSENYLGYSTKWGDDTGDFSPLGNLTCREVIQLGEELGLPYELVHKIPSDGLCGKSDEDNFGFTYDEVDDYLMYAKKGIHFDEIKKRHDNNSFKTIYSIIDTYNPYK